MIFLVVDDVCRRLVRETFTGVQLSFSSGMLLFLWSELRLPNFLDRNERLLYYRPRAHFPVLYHVDNYYKKQTFVKLLKNASQKLKNTQNVIASLEPTLINRVARVPIFKTSRVLNFSSRVLDMKFCFKIEYSCNSTNK